MAERVRDNLDVLGNRVLHPGALPVAFLPVSATALGGAAMGTPAPWRFYWRAAQANTTPVAPMNCESANMRIIAEHKPTPAAALATDRLGIRVAPA